ncbi:glycoside hydrolase 43 family protein [Kribbella amoyensis]|uniref:glycoside hydrolase family 43 protein n=1 Tax=Kribbella amoyensis TaxID=996641 RepID=UPI0014785162|nr:glycoside hydrolase 43 family protein [Kribbella amoyensis]
MGSLDGWGLLGDGIYANPVLPGDYSDPDVIRVGDDYWMITSTFQYSPGMAVLHSRDLISWRHVGAVLPDVSELGPAYRWNRMERYNLGIYAGSLRFHAGRYWVHFTTLDEGIFVTTAEHPAGPWTPLHCLSDEAGWDDPCPLWDNDGRAWLVASSPGHGRWITQLIPMSPDGRSIDLAARTVIDDFHTSEGNKIHRIDGRYYVLHNEVRGDGNRVLVIMRAEALTGPWEKRLLLQGEGPDREREPNQGALVDHPDGSWSLVTHHGRGGYAEGRPISVLPVEWKDGWPVVNPADPGRMLWRAELPVLADRAADHEPGGRGPVEGSLELAPELESAPELALDEDFDGEVLGPEWEWNHAPRPGSWEIADGLVLRASRPLRPGELRAIPSTLTRRMLGTNGSTATVRVGTDRLGDGQSAGLGMLCRDSSSITVCRDGDVLGLATSGEHDATGPTIDVGPVWLRLVIDARGYVTYAFSLDGETYQPVGNTDSVSWSDYRGARIALFSTGPADDVGAARFDGFRYRVEPRHR